MTPEDKMFVVNLWHNHNQFMRNRIIHFQIREADVEDVLNDCFVGLIRTRSSLREMPQDELQKYIAITVRNQCFKWHYNHNKAFLLALDDDNLSVYGRTSFSEEEDLISKMDAKEQTALVLNNLSERDKTLLLGRFIIGRTDEELANELHCKKSSIRAMMTRAKRNAKDILYHQKGEDSDGQE